jgi:hypothetical protein
MAKRKTYTPNKIGNKVQEFIYELRLWDKTTKEGKLETSLSFAFPVENNLSKADRYAFDFAVVAWAYVTVDVSDFPAIDTAERIQAILDDDGIAALDEIRAQLSGPCYGQLIRHPTKISFGAKKAEYCTVQDGRFKVVDAVTAADTTIGRLSA